MIDKPKSGDVLQIATKKRTQPAAIPAVSDLIGERLRSFYDDVAKQPVPDRFLDLLNQLQDAGHPEKKS